MKKLFVLIAMLTALTIWAGPGAGPVSADTGGGGLSAGSASSLDPPLSPFTSLSLASPGGTIDAVVYDGNEFLAGSSVTTPMGGFGTAAAGDIAKTTYVVVDGQCGNAAPNGCTGVPTGGSGDTLSFTGGAGTLTDGPDAFKGSDPCPWGPDTCLWDTRNFDVSAEVAPGDTSVSVTVTSGNSADGTDCINHEAQVFARGPAAAWADAGYVAAGAGLRNQGSGTITISGIPAGSTVKKAYLFWNILNPTDPGGAMMVNATSTPGTLVAPGGDPCWDSGSWAYEADVTLVVTGNGSYTVLGYPTGSTSGLDPWHNPSPTPIMEGASLIVFSEKPARKCPLTEGFWKNNPSAWPVTSLTLGSQIYTEAELLAILNTPVGSGNKADASLILADQLIAAKLNIANGSDPTPVSATIADADSLLSGFSGKLPYKVKPSSATGQQMVSDANTLDSYNSDLLTPNCLP